MQAKNSPIGIFDSGVGGLTVLQQLTAKFKHESFIYYGDNGRAPYGCRSKAELLQFNNEIIRFLQAKGIKLLVMACNTSCALVLQDIQSSVQIIGLIEPAAKAASEKTQNQRVAILATEQTVRSNAYQTALLQHNPQLNILQVACPQLVPIVENQTINLPQSREIALSYFKQVQDFGADTIIYGCSHYPYFEDIFKSVPSAVRNFIDPAKSIVAPVQAALDSLNLHSQNSVGSLEFWVSGDVPKFQHFLDSYFTWPKTPLFSHQFELA